ncbi:MAG: dihydropteroate synthase [Bacteroidales bacterium]|nr:dihydropteroate synthase [Bacteroidales bacterium]MDY6348190.1 dihydropteroate synthase [Bacteroidales bacterium]
MYNFRGRINSGDPLVMGILNVTEDSFFDGGRYTSEEAILARARRIVEDGGDIIDVGAMSTRPNAAEIPENVETEKICSTVRLLRRHFPEAVISVDTYRSAVAQAAVEEGADMVNDISGGTFDSNMIPTIGKLQVPYCAMHTPAPPQTMQSMTAYDDILADILKFFGDQIRKLREHHVHDIIIDPGFGFGKTLEQNYFLMKNLEVFKELGYPLLVGISRKSMIYRLLGTDPDHALNGTTVLNTIALMKGASILRVHDVKEAVEARTIFLQQK